MTVRYFVYTSSLLCVLFLGCERPAVENTYHLPDWSSRKATLNKEDSLKFHKTYLPVYAQIYHITHETKVNLAATISIRNTDTESDLYLKSINYYNTEGKLIRKYITEPVEIKACETIEIVIGTNDNEGGTGANFIFEWTSKNPSSKPLFEAIMITTAGQQGIAFTCRGIDLN